MEIVLSITLYFLFFFVGYASANIHRLNKAKKLIHKAVHKEIEPVELLEEFTDFWCV